MSVCFRVLREACCCSGGGDGPAAAAPWPSAPHESLLVIPAYSGGAFDERYPVDPRLRARGVGDSQLQRALRNLNAGILELRQLQSRLTAAAFCLFAFGQLILWGLLGADAAWHPFSGFEDVIVIGGWYLPVFDSFVDVSKRVTATDWLVFAYDVATMALAFLPFRLMGVVERRERLGEQMARDLGLSSGGGCGAGGGGCRSVRVERHQAGLWYVESLERVWIDLAAGSSSVAAPGQRNDHHSSGAPGSARDPLSQVGDLQQSLLTSSA